MSTPNPVLDVTFKQVKVGAIFRHDGICSYKKKNEKLATDVYEPSHIYGFKADEPVTAFKADCK